MEIELNDERISGKLVDIVGCFDEQNGWISVEISELVRCPHGLIRKDIQKDWQNANKGAAVRLLHTKLRSGLH